MLLVHLTVPIIGIFYTVVSVLHQTSPTVSALDCDFFKEAQLCISRLSNLIDRRPTEDEVECQELCQSHAKCNNFTFVKNHYPLETGAPDLQCYLWKRCISKVNCFCYYCNIKTIPLGVLLFNGLRLLSFRTSKTLDDFLLLLPVPAWCLRCPTNPILASYGRRRVPEEVSG